MSEGKVLGFKYPTAKNISASVGPVDWLTRFSSADSPAVVYPQELGMFALYQCSGGEMRVVFPGEKTQHLFCTCSEVVKGGTDAVSEEWVPTSKYQVARLKLGSDGHAKPHLCLFTNIAPALTTSRYNHNHNHNLHLQQRLQSPPP